MEDDDRRPLFLDILEAIIKDGTLSPAERIRRAIQLLTTTQAFEECDDAIVSSHPIIHTEDS